MAAAAAAATDASIVFGSPPLFVVQQQTPQQQQTQPSFILSSDETLQKQPHEDGFIGPLRLSDEMRRTFGVEMPNIENPRLMAFMLFRMDEEAVSVANVGLWNADTQAYFSEKNLEHHQALGAWASYTNDMEWWTSRYEAVATVLSAGYAAMHVALKIHSPLVNAAKKVMVTAENFHKVFGREEKKYPNGEDGDEREQDFAYHVRARASNTNPGNMCRDWSNLELGDLHKQVVASGKAIAEAAKLFADAYDEFDELILQAEC